MTVGGATNITAMGGADQLFIDATTFQGTFTANLGAWNDTIAIAQQVGEPVPVTFESKVTINAGAGNDTRKLGLSVANGGDANSRVAFGVASSQIDGGIGFNMFDASTSQYTGLTAANFLHWTNV
jgi:hypothetical protein